LKEKGTEKVTGKKNENNQSDSNIGFSFFFIPKYTPAKASANPFFLSKQNYR